jgi:hypothetical protein
MYFAVRTLAEVFERKRRHTTNSRCRGQVPSFSGNQLVHARVAPRSPDVVRPGFPGWGYTGFFCFHEDAQVRSFIFCCFQGLASNFASRIQEEMRPTKGLPARAGIPHGKPEHKEYSVVEDPVGDKPLQARPKAASPPNADHKPTTEKRTTKTTKTRPAAAFQQQEAKGPKGLTTAAARSSRSGTPCFPGVYRVLVFEANPPVSYLT